MNIAIGENKLMNKFRLIQLPLMLAAGALLLLSPGRIGAQALSLPRASSPQPSPPPSPTPTARPAPATTGPGRAVGAAQAHGKNRPQRPTYTTELHTV